MHGTDSDSKMSDFNKSLMDACDILREIGPRETECLQEFINCKTLIDWLKKSMESKLEFLLQCVKMLYVLRLFEKILIFNLVIKVLYSWLLMNENTCINTEKNLSA